MKSYRISAAGIVLHDNKILLVRYNLPDGSSILVGPGGGAKKLTQMIDNLYLDRLQRKITESVYDKFYQSMRDQITDIEIRFERLQAAEDNYHFNATFVLEIIKRAHELFVNAEIEEKRQLIKLILSNLRIDGENLMWDVQKPFDLFLNKWNGLF